MQGNGTNIETRKIFFFLLVIPILLSYCSSDNPISPSGKSKESVKLNLVDPELVERSFEIETFITQIEPRPKQNDLGSSYDVLTDDQKKVVEQLADKKVNTFTEADKAMYTRFTNNQKVYFRAITKLITTKIVLTIAKLQAKNEELLNTAKNGEYEKVVEILNIQNINLNIQDLADYTPLHYASEEGYLEIVQALLAEERIQINIQSSSGNTALHRATLLGHYEIVQALLAEERIQINIQSSSGYTPLHNASRKGHYKIVQALLGRQAEIEINRKDNRGNTPLHYAAREGHYKIVQALLADTRIQANTQSSSGYTPLHYAAREGHIEIVQFLIEKKADQEITSKDSKTALNIATLEVSIWLLIQQKGRPRKDSLDTAYNDLKARKKTAVETLAKKTVDTFTVEDEETYGTFTDNQKVYFQAITKLITTQEKVIPTAVQDTVRELIKRITRPNLVALNPAYDAITDAAEKTAVETLAKKTVDTFTVEDAKTYEAFTDNQKVYFQAITEVITTQEKIIPTAVQNIRTFKQIIQSAGRPKERVLDSAYNALKNAQEKRVVEDLAKKTTITMLDINTYKGFSAEQKVYFRAKTQLITTETMTAVVYCKSRGTNDENSLFAYGGLGSLKNLKEVQFKLSQGTCPNYKGFHGNTTLHMAASARYLDVLRELLKVRKLNINIQNNAGDTSLHAAARAGHLDVIEELVKNGADTKIQNKYHQTALQVAQNQERESLWNEAKRTKYKAIVEWLINRN